MRLSQYNAQRAALRQAIADAQAALTAFDATYPAPTPLYFTNAVTDGYWEQVENWTEDAEGQVPAQSLPDEGEDVVILSTLLMPPPSAVTLGKVTVDNVQANLGYVTATKGFHFKRDSIIAGDLTGYAVVEGNTNMSGSVLNGDAEAHYPVAYPFTVATGTVNYHGYVFGCTDFNATNYNSEANTDDGSCVYA